MRTGVLALVAGGSAVMSGSAGAQPPALYDLREVTSIAQGMVSGTVTPSPVPGFELIVMKDGRLIYARSFGTWSPGRVAGADSATKTLSGAVVMSVVDSSVTPVSLETRLSEVLPGFTGLKALITLRQAFSHSSGLPGNVGGISNPELTLQQAAQLVAAAPLVHGPPGSRFAYGGASMQAAGALAEVVTGQSFAGLLQSRITGPLGLSQTRFYFPSVANPLVGGGAESTAWEFARFMEMIRRGGVGLNGTRVLSEASAEALMTRQTGEAIAVAFSPYQGSAAYGVGAWLDRREPGGAYSGVLAAGARGFSAWIERDAGVVGALATDLSTASNVGVGLAELRSALLEAVGQPWCYANCDFSTGTPALTPADFVCFLARFRAGDPQANCDGSTGSPALTPADFVCFLNAYRSGC